MAKQTFLELELESDPHKYDKPWSNELIDRKALVHVVANVDRPESVSRASFETTLTAVLDTLDKFPYLKIKPPRPIDLELLEGSGFEI